MNFATLKGLTIPVDKETATITLKGDFMWSGVRYNGVYYGSNTVTPVTFTANIGDEIFIETYGAEDSYITLNGKEVANEPGEAEYYYTVVGDTVIEATADGSGYDSSSSIDITARRAGVVTQIADASGRVLWSAVRDPVITIIFDPDTYEAFGETQYRCGNLIIGDTTYNANFFLSNAIDQYTLTVPVGTTIGCIIRAMGTGYAGEVRINGETVLSGGYQTYEYTATTNATIVLTATVKNITNYADSVYITET